MTQAPALTSHELAFRAIQACTQEFLGETVLYRVRVGRALVEHLYQQEDPDSVDGSIKVFFQRYRSTLSGWGLGEATLRRCVAAAEVARGIPEDTLRRLDFSHLWTAHQIQDPVWRAALVALAAENQWSVAELRQAMTQVEEGRPPHDDEPTCDDDARPDAGPGPAPADGPDRPMAPTPPPIPMRAESVVRRFRQTAGALDALVASVASRGTRRLTPKQARDAWETVDQMEARLAMLKAKLPPRAD